MVLWKKRLLNACIVFFLSSAGVFILLTSVKDNLLFFYTPTDLKVKRVNTDNYIRIGGLVKHISHKDAQTIQFIVSDNHHEVAVVYKGIIPGLFKEGQGAIVLGKLISANYFEAKEVLAKHDETYKPK